MGFRVTGTPIPTGMQAASSSRKPLLFCKVPAPRRSPWGLLQIHAKTVIEARDYGWVDAVRAGEPSIFDLGAFTACLRLQTLPPRLGCLGIL